MTGSSQRPSGEPQDEGFFRQAGRVFLVSLYAALRSLRLYPVENAAVQRSLDDLQQGAATILAREGEIEIRLSGDFLFVNGTRLRLEMDNYASFSNVQTLLRAFDIERLVVRDEIERREWQAFLSILLALADTGNAEERFLGLTERLAQAGVERLTVAEGRGQGLDDEASREQAKRTYAQGVAVTKEVVNSIRLGRTTNVKKAKRAVQLIVDQVLNNETSIIGLTTLRDYDEYTFTHSVNVCIFAIAIGRRMGLTRIQLYDLGLTALLHDIGKARLPLEVLNKPSGLDEAEWQILQTHTWRGSLALFGLRASFDEIPYRAILVAHEHHMKTDLTGYPRHLRRRSLGVYSRLVAVADGFDAATSRRAYQTVPIEPDEVLREMWSNPRRGYDQVMVKALINVLGIYPVGTVVILDTFEVGVVAGANPDPQYLNRPRITLVLDENGAPVPPPGETVNLADRRQDGGFARTIVKVTSPERHGLDITPYFL
jgi:HD-GYP domain-containing protein (c-di-GMP phosphodiesterase class II)